MRVIDFPNITGPDLPYKIHGSAMASSEDKKGVTMFGGDTENPSDRNKILEHRFGSKKWNTLDATLPLGRRGHAVIPLPDENLFEKIVGN